MAAKRRNAAQWRRLISEWESSELGASEFARRRGLNVSTLRWWRWRLREEPHEALEVPSFFEVLVEEAPAPELVVELGDIRVRVPSGFDAGELRRLVAALC